MALLEIGFVARAHGLTGEVVVGLITNVEDRVTPGARFTVLRGRSQESNLVPDEELEVRSVRPHQGRLLVRFTTVTTREQAEALQGMVLAAEPVEDDDAYFVHDLIGCSVRDTLGIDRGIVTGVEANPASDLLVVDERFYVPLRFVTGREDKTLVIDAPDGLFE